MRRVLLGFFVTVTFAQKPAIDPAKVLDLTYPFDGKTIYWPTAKSFQWKKDTWGISPGGYWLAMGSYAASEHGGTHLDAPLHFSEGKWSVDEIPLNNVANLDKVPEMGATLISLPMKIRGGSGGPVRILAVLP